MRLQKRNRFKLVNTYEVSQILEQRRERHRQGRSARLRRLEKLSPEYSDLVSKRNELFASAAIERIKGNKKKAEQLEKEAQGLDRREKEILQELNLPQDYLELHYDCPICQDKGFTPEGMCSCLKSLINEASFHEYDLTEQFQNNNFENFNLSLFSEEIDQKSKISPRMMIQIALKKAHEYCDHFDSQSRSLILYGPVGTGKTYMISCIVNELIKKNVDLIYISAPNLINLVFDDINQRTPAKQSNKERLKNVDLLIIDDLGTEVDNEFNRSVISEILDERQLAEKRTIITSNFSPEMMLKGRYPERMISRIYKYFDRLIFIGPDLRRPSRP